MLLTGVGILFFIAIVGWLVWDINQAINREFEKQERKKWK